MGKTNPHRRPCLKLKNAYYMYMKEGKKNAMRVDDFKNAVRLASQELTAKDPDQVAKASGAQRVLVPASFQLNFFGRPVTVSTPDMTVTWRDQKPGEEFNLTDAVLILHYLNGATGDRPTGEMVAYRQISGGEFYAQAFHSRAEIPLAKTFGQTKGLLTRTIQALNGEPTPGFGDEAGRFRVLPNLDLLVIIYLADEEFESTGQVLFDKVIGSYLSNEDISWLGSALIYRLMSATRNLPTSS